VVEISISYLHCLYRHGKPVGGWWCTGITEVDWVFASLYIEDSEVDRYTENNDII